MNKTLILLGVSMVALFGSISTGVCAGCEIVDGTKKIPFDWKALKRVLIEKKSLTILNSEYPNLNVIEKMYTGELQTCTDCTERHITCWR